MHERLLNFFYIFRFFNDSAGNQIGYAFCEYDNQEMAVRAIHKLNNLQFKGQILKVDTAASDKSKEELESKFIFRIVLRYFRLSR